MTQTLVRTLTLSSTPPPHHPLNSLTLFITSPAPPPPQQDGKFDAADRMFVSVADTWRSCLSNPADLKVRPSVDASAWMDGLTDWRD